MRPRRALPPPQPVPRKRYIIDISHSDDEDQCRRSPKRKKTLLVNNHSPIPSSGLGTDDNIHVKHRAAEKQSARAKSKPPRQPTLAGWLFNPEARLPLQELDAKQWQSKLSSPRAFCQLPDLDENFLSQFNPPCSSSKAVPQASLNQQLDVEDDANKTGAQEQYHHQLDHAVRRSKKTSARVYFPVNSEDDSPDELCEAAPVTHRRSAVKSRVESDFGDELQSSENSDDSDFEDEHQSFENAEESEGFVYENAMDLDSGSSVQAEIVTDEEEMELQAKPKQKRNTENMSRTKTKSTSGRSKTMKSLHSRKGKVKGLDVSLPPLYKISDIFKDLTERAVSLGLDKAVGHLGSRPVRVATMCSGTESPVLALQMINDTLRDLSLDLNVEHVFSAEIVPFKQAYIERNFHPPVIFRDITELTAAVKDKVPMATTAYGGKQVIPTNIHVLIVGTSCVDFSGLNSHRKGIHDGGESGDTWHAVVAYCTAFRPAIVLLENVLNADWDTMLADFANIEYECGGAYVDTKDYYIPHTRQRGYMVCFDKRRGVSGGSASAKWEQTMDQLQRPASAPASSFLLPNDQVARQQLHSDDPIREWDWSKCEITQMEYRSKTRIGFARPITHWSESGSMLVPENGNRPWYTRQVERVLDTIDAATLRKALPANGMYDTRYKTRIWNLSQNIYRDEDRQPFGIVGCITPSGLYFISDAGRAMTPEETLKLQGLPLDRISFTTESASEMQDLAGNAMSSTVIGSSILSALIAGFKFIDPERPIIQDQLTAIRPADFVCGSMKLIGLNTAKGVLDPAKLLQNADRSLRRCYCEGPRGMARKPIQQCSECGHTTCTSCGGNPAHQYRNSDLINRCRVSPAQFEDQLRSILPLQLVFSDVEGLLARSSLSNRNNYLHALKSAVSARFSFKHIRRTSCWTASYGGDGANLNLVFEDGGKAEWQLFALPLANLPCNDPLRRILEQPVLKTSVSEKLLGDCWLIRTPGRKRVPMNIVGSGIKTASWWSRNEMPDFVNHFVWQYLIVEINQPSELDQSVARSISGQYRYLRDCGTACDGLYQKMDDTGMFLFLDPTRTAEPDSDCFVFSRNKSLLEYDEVRPILAQVAAPWRPWSMDGSSSEAGPSRAMLIVDDEWTSSSSRLLVPTSSLVLRQPVPIANVSECMKSAVLVSCTISRENLPDSYITGPVFIKLEDASFFEAAAWIFEAIRRHLPKEAWSMFNCSDFLCRRCAPARPALRWKLAADDSVVPFEDPEGAALYERAIKARPDALMIKIEPKETDVDVTVGINIATLAHIAGARLPSGLLDVQVSWRFLTSTHQDSPYVFKPFKLKSTENMEPHQGKLNMSVELFPKQLLALAWMRQQETGVDFIVEQSEEASIASLGWRAEVRAQGKVRVRGGICADHPGFGKTITSLALIHSQLNDMAREDIVSGFLECGFGLIPTAATLIVAPTSLLRQWKEEIRDKLPHSHRVVSINTISDLDNLSIDKIKDADIVIVNRTLLGNESYTERLATFAAMPGPATKSGRSFAHWLRLATTVVADHVRILGVQDGKALQEKNRKALQEHIRVTYRAHIQNESFKASVPSRRLRGSNYVAAKSQKGLDKKAAFRDVDTKNVDKPLLEMFHFNRIIIDEFHQYEPKEYAAIVNLKADKRWGLSATPAMGDFYDVAQMAGLLHVPLRIGSDARGVLKAKSIKELRKDLTSFELFDAMRQTPSDALHYRIHELDQLFLDMFVRQNIMDFSEMKYQDHLVPTTLSLTHRALYTELSQQLNSLDMRIRKGSKAKATDRQQRFNQAVESSATAEEALSKTAVYFDGNNRGLKHIVEARQKEMNSFLVQLPAAISAAKNEKDQFNEWRASQVDGGFLGDAATVSQIAEIIEKSAKSSKGVSKVHRRSESDIDVNGDSDDGRKKKTKGRSERVSALNILCKRLVTANRSLRFLKNVDEVHQINTARSTSCDNPECPGISTHDDIAVSALCGHLICSHCRKQMTDHGLNRCPADSSCSAMQNFHLLWAKKISDVTSTTAYGAKIDAAMNLLAKIEGEKEQAILFVQFENQLDEIGQALSERGISATVVRNAKTAGQQIADFRQTAGTKKQTAVIVLNASDETAAGSNLQNANHVVFLSPLLRDTQYGYDSTMAQAIGRVRRFGQKREIHVYRIVALDTIDVDILEHREKRTDALIEQGAAYIAPPTTVVDAESEKMQLVQQNGRYSLRPQSWLVDRGAQKDDYELDRVAGKSRVLGWEDFSSLVKFSKAFTDNDG